MTCFFIGHRDAPEDIYAKLREAVADHITEHGVTDFVVGHYGRFDSMAARAVREEKAQYGDKYDFWTMIGAKCEVAEMLDEEEPRSIRERLRRKEIEKQRAERQGTPRTQKNKDRGWER